MEDVHPETGDARDEDVRLAPEVHTVRARRHGAAARDQRLAMLLTLAAGVWEGAIALLFRLFSPREPTVLTVANHLPAPWCYLAAVGAMALAFAVIAILSRAHERAVAATGS